jgi:hypothetical protein
MSDLSAKVKRMTAILDEKRPGWRDEIDVEKLDFNSIRNCVLGQLYGSYTQGLVDIGYPNATEAWQIDHAVELPHEGSWFRIEYKPLTEAWKKELQGEAA